MTLRGDANSWEADECLAKGEAILPNNLLWAIPPPLVIVACECFVALVFCVVEIVKDDRMTKVGIVLYCCAKVTLLIWYMHS